MIPQELIQKYDLSISTVFVPYSQSRNAIDNWESLNWKVTLLKGKQEVLTADYSCGIAHCPGFKRKWEQSCEAKAAAACEIETGRAVCSFSWSGLPVYKGPYIEPEFADVLYSLVMDSDVVDYCDFKDWCENFGYSSDSIKAKKVYDSCLETALKLRGTLGQSFFDDAETAFEDY